MKIKDSTALVTGANGGIGEEFVKALIAADIKKVYVTGRNVDSLYPLKDIIKDRGEILKLDITKPEDIETAARLCTDVNLLINNAGVNFNTPLIGVNTLENARVEMETNYYGTLSMCRAFTPILKANGGGSIVNILSILSRVNIPLMGSLCASKASALSMTQGVRAELAAHGTTVIAVMPGAVDTRMSKDFQGPKISPVVVVEETLKAVEEGTEEVYPGDMASEIAAGLDKDPKATEKELSKFLPQ